MSESAMIARNTPRDAEDLRRRLDGWWRDCQQINRIRYDVYASVVPRMTIVDGVALPIVTYDFSPDELSVLAHCDAMAASIARSYGLPTSPLNEDK